VRRTRVEQQAETHRRLLDAARAVIVEHGVDAATIDDITARAGFSRGAFYSNFTDKADLLVQLCERQVATFTDEVLPGFLALDTDERLTAVARWLAQDETPIEVLLVVELARYRQTDAAASRAADRVMSQVSDDIESLLAIEGSELAGLTADERRRRARALLAAILGADLLKHVGLALDEVAIETLLRGVLLAPDPTPAPNGSDRTADRVTNPQGDGR
jgi:AcrR family transcriptional regulator